MTTIDAAVLAGVFGAIMALIEVIKIYASKGRSHPLSDGFRQADRFSADDTHRIVAGTGSQGEILVYGASQLQKLMEDQGKILSDIRTILQTQTSTMIRRVEVCEGHSRILDRWAAKEGLK